MRAARQKPGVRHRRGQRLRIVCILYATTGTNGTLMTFVVLNECLIQLIEVVEIQTRIWISMRGGSCASDRQWQVYAGNSDSVRKMKQASFLHSIW